MDAGQLSVSTALFDGYPWDVALAEIAAAGARWVEPAFIRGYVDFDEDMFSAAAGSSLARRIEAAGLSCRALSAHTDLGEADAVAAIERRLEFAAAAGATFLITNSSVRQKWDLFCENLERILPLCQQAMVFLALENPGHGADSLIGSGRDGAELVRKFDSPWLQLNYDFGNWFTYAQGAPADGDFEAALPHVVHAHLKDIVSSSRGWEFCALGEGVIDYRSVFATLRRTAPQLPLSLELPLRLMRPQRGDPVRRNSPLEIGEVRRALQRSLAFLDWTA